MVAAVAGGLVAVVVHTGMSLGMALSVCVGRVGGGV
jgi:hypothetical protein